MAYLPITGTVTQYQKENGSFALNYYLKFYIAGTTTPLSCAPNAAAEDDDGNPSLLEKVRINESGYPVNPTGGVIIPHVNTSYKLIFYKNAADADSNNTSSAEWTADNVTPGLVDFTLSSTTPLASDVDYLADTNATTRKLDLRLQETLSVADFAADPSGTNDSTNAFTNALAESLNVFVPSGTYLVDSVKVIRDFQNVKFGGGVVLKARSNDEVLFHQASSLCVHSGGFFVDTNGKSNITGMLVGPEDLTDLLTISNQTDNTLPEIYGDSGVTELVAIQVGPDVGGSNSIIRGNTFPKIALRGALRGLFMQRPLNAGGYPSHSNNFLSIIATNASTTNTVVDIESGFSNTFHDVSCTTVTANGAPATTATGIIVDNVCPATGTGNNNNVFLQSSFVSCNRDIENSNATTTFLANNISDSNSLLTAYPKRFTETNNRKRTHEGRVNSNGTAAYTPNGFSAPSQITQGTYEISHSIGNTAYNVSATVLSSNASIGVGDITNTSFRVYVRAHNSSAFADAAFFYTVTERLS